MDQSHGDRFPGTEEIRDRLFSMQDLQYRDFQSGLIPGVGPDRFIGVRTPALRAYAKELAALPAAGEGAAAFLHALPHRYFDENQLHAFLIAGLKDFRECMAETERFLPYIDNWATCDQLSPKVFKKHRQELLPYIERWIRSDRTYTIRFGIGMLMQHFLDGDFDPAFPETVAGIRSEEYYVNMMRAWYFATALAKQYEAVLPYLTERRLDRWTHNKTIQKAVESFRITPEQKGFLKTCRIC